MCDAASIYWEQQRVLTEDFGKMNLAISDYTFANVFLFRDTYRYRILGTNCGSFISAHNRHNENYIMPLVDLRTCNPAMLKDLLNKDSFFFPVPEEWLSFFPEDQFRITFDDGESDYIYLTENMASFKGGQYTRHRNHINQFNSLYAPQAKDLGKDNILPAKMILQDWQNESRMDIHKTDFTQCHEALESIEKLALWGVIYFIENEPAGFVIGEPLNNDTFVLHFAKAAKKYHGIYEFMFNDAAKRLAPQYQYLNLEEDMGNKNLRRTKASYGPEKLLKKFRVYLK